MPTIPHSRGIDRREKGTCPNCHSINYVRSSLEPEDDVVFCECKCENCGQEFEEAFDLSRQHWKTTE